MLKSDDILFREGDDERSDLADMSIRERTVKVAMMIAERNGEDMAARDAAIEALGHYYW